MTQVYLLLADTKMGLSTQAFPTDSERQAFFNKSLVDALDNAYFIDLDLETGVSDTYIAFATSPEDPGQGVENDCPMDGDAESALASVGWGTDEDYGCFGGEGDL